MKKLIAAVGCALIALGVSTAARAEGLYVTPSVGAGFNTAQETYYRIGFDVGYRWDENIYFGAGVYYSAGSHPSNDREIGGGPFVGYVLPFLEIFSLQLREDIDYVDQYNPVLHYTVPEYYSHTDSNGLESSTYAGVHIAFTPNFGVSAGYRAVFGITNSSLGTGRSGTAIGVTFGF